MTKLAKIAAVAGIVMTLAACSHDMGTAQRESTVTRGDATFSHAQHK